MPAGRGGMIDHDTDELFMALVRRELELEMEGKQIRPQIGEEIRDPCSM